MLIFSLIHEFKRLASGFIFAEFMLCILVMGSIGICLIIVSIFLFLNFIQIFSSGNISLFQPGSEGGLIFLAFVGGCAISTLFLTTWFFGDVTYEVIHILILQIV